MVALRSSRLAELPTAVAQRDGFAVSGIRGGTATFRVECDGAAFGVTEPLSGNKARTPSLSTLSPERQRIAQRGGEAVA
jgi:hypothetical protein